MKVTRNQLRRIIRQTLLERRQDSRGYATSEGDTLTDQEAIEVLENELDTSEGVIEVKDFLNSPEGSDSKVRDFLTQTNDPSEKISVVDDTIQISKNSPKPTQNEISIYNSIGWPLSKMESLRNIKSGDPTGGHGNDPNEDGSVDPNRVIISGDLVIDGHHRWSQVFAIGGPGNDLMVKDIGLPGGTANEKLAVAQVAIVATMGDPDRGKVDKGPVPSKGGSGLPDNILGVDKTSIKEMILGSVGQNMDSGLPMMGPEWIAEARTDAAAQGFFGITEDMRDEDVIETVAEKVADNLANLPGMAAGAPAREHMPQFDMKTDPNDVFDKMDSGGVNFKPPFDPGLDESVSLKRWQRLAGLLKD